METDPFKRSSSESSSEHSGDSSEESSSKKKKKTRRLPLVDGEKDTKSEKKDSGADKADTVEDAALLWRRLISQTTGTGGGKMAEAAKDTAPKTTEAPKSPEQPLETLSHEERAAVAAEYIKARRAELAAEVAAQGEGKDEVEAAEQAANLALLEEMQQMLERDADAQVGAEDEPLEESLQDAYKATARHLTALQAEAVNDQSSDDNIEDSGLSAVTTSSAVPLFWHRGGAGGSGTPTGPTGSRGFGANGGNGNVIFTRPGAATEAASASVVETVDNSPNRTGSALLVGGVVGYLIGRRRGRIKTEKRLKAVEKKLSAEVKLTRQQVAEKEQQIRHLARETFQQTKRRLFYESPAAAFAERPAINRTESGPQTTREERLGLGVVTLRAAEAVPVMSGRVERVPHTKLPKNEQNDAKEKLSKDVRPERKIPKSSQMMDRTELLQAGGEIRVGATNLRRVYETNLISEQGLRRLVAVHERGGNVKEVLEQELIEKELSFERDPRLRNRSRSMVGSLASSAVVRAEIDEPFNASVADKNSDASATGTGKEDPEADTPQPSQTAMLTAGIAMFIILAVLLYLLLTGKSL